MLNLGDIETLIRTNPPLAFLAVFLAGIGVSLTPCVYPVIPITLGFIGARAHKNRMRGLSLSLVYVSGMALTYALLGAWAALTGKLFGQIAQHPLVNFVIANICIAIGASMLGAFDLPQMALAKLKMEAKKGYGTAFFVGIASGLIVGPCTAPVLAAILLFVASGQNVVYGFSLLLVFGYGVGSLLVVLGTFSGLIAALPKPGPWQDRVKKVFGWILILTGEYFLIKLGGILR